MKKRKANHYCNVLNIDYIHTKDQRQVKFTLASAAERNLHGPNFISGFYWFYRWVTAYGYSRQFKVVSFMNCETC